MTSIEFLIEEMLSKGFFKESVTLTNIDHLQYKAEEMHKQEILLSYHEGSEDLKYNPQEYYNETFVSKGSGMSEKPNNHIEAELPKQETLYTEEQMVQAIKFFITYKAVADRDVWDKDIHLYIQSLKKK